MTLHERIALHLGWTVREAQSFSYPSLRELVTCPKLKAELSSGMRSGSYILQEREGSK